MRRTQERTNAPTQRQLRVGELIRHALADLLARGDIMDPELAAMSITVPEVRVSPDLRNATIYVTPLGGGDPQPGVKALTRHKGFIRGRIAKAINLKYAPDIVFRHDDRFEESARIDAILRSPEVLQDLEKPDEAEQD